MTGGYKGERVKLVLRTSGDPFIFLFGFAKVAFFRGGSVVLSKRLLEGKSKSTFQILYV